MKQLLNRIPRWAAFLVVGIIVVIGDKAWSSIDVWEAQPGIIKKVATLHEKGDIWGVSFSPDGQFVAVTGANSIKVQVWNWRQNHLVRTLYKGRGATSLMSTRPVLYSPDGRYLAACHQRAKWGKDYNVVINVWNAHTGKLIKNIDSGNCTGMAFTPNSRELLKIGSMAVDSKWFHGLAAYSTRSWKRLWGIPSKDFVPSTVAVSPNGKMAAVGGHWFGPTKTIFQQNEQLQIRIIDLASHQVIRTIATAFPNPPPENGAPVELSTIQCLSWNSVSTEVAAGVYAPSWWGADAIRIFNVANGKKVLGQPGPWPTNIKGLSYTLDGRFLIEDGIGHSFKVLGHRIINGHYIEIWDATYHHLLARINGAADSIAVSQNGQYLATGGVGYFGGGKVIVWKLK